MAFNWDEFEEVTPSSDNLDKDFYKNVAAQIESGNNYNAKNPKSSAHGKYQFLDSTWNSLGGGDRNDPKEQERIMDKFTQQNIDGLRKAGIPVTNENLYLAHQQGLGGALKLLRDPSKKAVDVVGRDAVRLNGGNENMTAGEFAKLWTEKVSQKSKQTGASMADLSPASGGTFNWDEFEEVTPSSSEFNWDEFEEVTPQQSQTSQPQEVSQTESAIRGLSQGMTGGFADEIMGAIGGAIAIGSDLFRSDEDKLFKDKSRQDMYRMGVETARGHEKRAEEANPGTYLTSQIGGAIASPVNKLGLPTAGAIYGAGSSEANVEDDPLQLAFDTALGATIGKVLPTAVGGAKDVASKAVDAAGNSLARYATNPLVSNVSKLAPSNLVPNIADKLSNAASKLDIELPSAVNDLLKTSVGKLASGVSSRTGAYSNPYTAIPQAINDTQKAAGWAADKLLYTMKNNPSRLGKYQANIENAIQRGGNSLAVTSFTLQNTDPEFRKLMEDLENEDETK